MTTKLPLIVQRDLTILADTECLDYASVRALLSRFAELERSPERIHFYRITPLSLWNAAATGTTVDMVIDTLSRFSATALPAEVVTELVAAFTRYGAVRIVKDGERLILVADDPEVLDRVTANRHCHNLIGERVSPRELVVVGGRGDIKQALVDAGYPPEDLAGYIEGTALSLALRPITASGITFGMRPYQRAAVEAFYDRGSTRGGSGVVVLPCGTGKTVVGIGALVTAATNALIITTNTVAIRQWIGEVLDKTTLTPDDVGEYSGERKEIRPVTVTTYQMLCYRPFAVDTRTGEVGEFPHLQLFNERNWGLLVYDEVHLLPAPIFRATAELQTRRRLGLTATLIREDGRERDVFALIGPKKYDLPWHELEAGGYIAAARCTEVRVPMDRERRMAAAVASGRDEAYRIAAENPAKVLVLEALLRLHRGAHILVIGQYLSQLHAVASQIDAPLLTGKTPTTERERLYNAFRAGAIPVLVVSKVANFAIDLPDADVAIQLSGTFGSRQEEAQRLGRILRPKTDGRSAHFYALVTSNSRDQDFARKRQLFLAEQGYQYTILDAADLAGL